MLRIRQHYIPDLASPLVTKTHVSAHADYAPQMGPVSGDVCTIGFAQKQKRNARKERHA